jgi:predicted DNA-binding protein
MAKSDAEPDRLERLTESPKGSANLAASRAVQPSDPRGAAPPATSEVTNTRNLSVRMDAELLNRLITVSKVQDRTMGEVIREAVRQYTDGLARDEDFIEAVKVLREELNSVLSAR